MRMISANEAMAAQLFPKDTLRPDNHKLTMHMTDNAVPPLAGPRVMRLRLIRPYYLRYFCVVFISIRLDF